MPVFRLSDDLLFPPPHMAVEDGLLAVGGDLSVERLLLAYQMGIFPWYSEGDPILWWSPDPRMVLFPSEFHVSRSFRRVLNQQPFRVTFDTAFREVIEACAAMRCKNRDSTWITPEMIAAYCRVHAAGYAHSVECWQEERLIGGMYGVSLGDCFFGESMFSRVSNGSKMALATLVQLAEAWGIGFIDTQVANNHLSSLGGREIPRAQFLDLLQHGLKGKTRKGSWTAAAQEALEG